ncbi:hypothetical protein BJ917_4682 [Pseudomonas sp. WPR_5_2]|nr:hypothetical protein BJ917_4682 [Pseudomonas sp. WPR_5_2]
MLSEIQFALDAAMVVITPWIKQRGSGDVGGNVIDALEPVGKVMLFTSGCSLPHKKAHPRMGKGG